MLLYFESIRCMPIRYCILVLYLYLLSSTVTKMGVLHFLSSMVCQNGCFAFAELMVCQN